MQPLRSRDMEWRAQPPTRRDQVGIYLFEILITKLHCNELGAFCTNSQNLTMTSLQDATAAIPESSVFIFIGQFYGSLWTSTHQCTMKDEW